MPNTGKRISEAYDIFMIGVRMLNRIPEIKIDTLKKLIEMVYEGSEEVQTESTMQIEHATLSSHLYGHLERTPTEQEVQDFAEYMKTDIHDWVSSNAKTFVRNIEA